MRTVLSIAAGLALALVAPAAFAQDGAVTAGGEGTLPPPKVTPKPAVETAVAGAKKEEEDPTTDHEKVVGHLGVGYFGLTNIPIAVGGAVVGAGAGLARGNVAAPVIGVRYWLNEKIGLDLGLGLGITGGSQEVVTGNVTTSQDRAGTFGMAFHGGVPIVLGHQKHYKFLVVPELNVGFATQTETPVAVPGAPVIAGDITRTGFHLDAGGRIGSEIHFGFIGVPQLSLQASVGLLVSHNAWKVKQDVGNQTNSASVAENTVGSTVQGDPWAIFVNNISAIYYLP